jgi:uncharacterized protein with GYD domain
MARFMFKVSYTTEGLQGVMKEGAAQRRAYMEKLLAEMGGSLASFDFAFGGTDLYAIAELPDQTTAAALATAVAASGTGRIETVVLLSPEDVDDAVAKHMPFRAPGA